MRQWIVAGLLLVGCSPGGAAIGQRQSALETDNGWNTNGWNTNGWNTNGWSTRAWNVSASGSITDSIFLSGLNATGANYNAWTMGYLVRCALPPGDCVSAVVGGVTRSWCGRLGLAPEWKTTGLSPSSQRWVSACMGAHFNRYGYHIRISVRGPSIALDQNELGDAPYQEAAFIGNLFDGTGLLACRGVDLSELVSLDQYLARVCGLDQCPTIGYLGGCQASCNGNGSSGYWLSCAGTNEVITTYLNADDAESEFGPGWHGPGSGHGSGEGEGS
jgi:hypothetical protein